MAKSYQFTTVREIVDQLSVEQIDDFLIDFRAWFMFIKTGKSNSKVFDDTIKDLREVVDIFTEAAGEKAPGSYIDTSKFGWNDDGVHKPKKIVIQGGKENIELVMPEEK